MRITDYIKERSLYIDPDQAQAESLKALRNYRDGINKDRQLEKLLRLHCLLLPKVALKYRIPLDEIAGYFWEAIVYSADKYDIDAKTNLRFGPFAKRKLTWILADYYTPYSQNIVKVPKKHMKEMKHTYSDDGELDRLPSHNHCIHKAMVSAISGEDYGDLL